MKAPLIPDLRDPVSKDLNSSTFLQPAGSFQGGKGKLRRLPYRIIYASSKSQFNLKVRTKDMLFLSSQVDVVLSAGRVLDFANSLRLSYYSCLL